MKNWFLLLSIVCLLFLPSCQRKEHTASTTVTVGASLPLTGDFSRYGIAIRNGIELAHSESDIKNKIRLVYEDDRGDPRTAVTVVNKLLSSDNVDVVVGGAASPLAAAIIPITSRNRTVLISPYATAETLFSEGNYFYSLLPSDSYEGLYMAEYIASQNVDSIGILFVNNDYGVGITSSFTEGLSKHGTTVLFSEGYAAGETNFRTQINRMRQLGVKAVYLPGYYAETSRILRQMIELGADFQIFGSSNFYDPQFLDRSDFSAEGVIFCYPEFYGGLEDTYESFVDNFTRTYGQQPDAFAIQGYNSFKLIERIVLENYLKGKIDFAVAMENIKDFQGVNSVINFAHDGSAIKPLTIMEIRNGQFQKKQI